MTERAYELDQRQRGPLVDRAKAFRDAGRHTLRVRILRWSIVLGALALALGGAVFALMDRLGVRQVDLTLARATLNGSRVTMDAPKLNGFRRDGRPYEVRARSGVQDVRTPKIIELNEVEANLQTADRTSVRVLAPEGVFDSGADRMRLQGRSGTGGTGAGVSGAGGSGAGDSGIVRVTSTSGYTIVMRSAEMDFKTGALRSNEPVAVTMTNGTVEADSLDVTGNGASVSFIGNVRSVIMPEAGMKPPAPGQERTAQ
jgi:lipopolysaccharide export system protein LptC